MSKNGFLTLVLGIIGSMVFALGMCMCLLPELGMFNTGIKVGVAGIIILLITWIVYRKISGKAPIKFDIKLFGKVLYGLVASLVMGAGMSMTMVFDGMMVQGIVVGMIGIVMLLFLIPMCFGWKRVEGN